MEDIKKSKQQEQYNADTDPPKKRVPSRPKYPGPQRKLPHHPLSLRRRPRPLPPPPSPHPPPGLPRPGDQCRGAVKEK